MHGKQRRTWTLLFLIALSSGLFAADYYWIGGSGDWSEINHWATTSGGILTHDQTPTAGDNVFFDENSFDAPGQVVTINGDLAFARNLDFSQALFNPTLRAGSQTSMTIFGSCMLIENMNFDFDGTLVLSGDMVDLDIDLAGHRLGENIVFDGGGGWRVLSNITVSNEVSILQGNVDFLADSIHCDFFTSATNLQRRISLHQTTIVVNGTTEDHYYTGSIINEYTVRLHALGLIIDGGTSTLIVTSDYAKIYMEEQGMVNFYNITASNPTGLFEIINHYDETEVTVDGTLDIRHTGTLLSTISIDTLRLTPSFSYQFEAGLTTQLGYLDAVGSCVESILISSTVSGDPARFRATNTITASYVTMRDIRLVAGSGQADNSIDLGNNDGWTIMSKSIEDFYWVGGTGNWDDPVHWSLSSGGPSAGCIPSSVDNVFFDENSFTQVNQIVAINVLNATCRDMTWTNVLGNPNFTGPVQNSMYINGSLTFTEDMNHDFEGSYFFISGEKGNTITMAGQRFNADVNFNNFEGEWILLDSVYVDHFIYLQDGTLNTNDQAIDCYSFNSEFNSPRQLILGSSTIRVIQREGELIQWNVSTDNFTLDAGTSHIILNGWYAFFNNHGNTRLNYHNVTHQGVRGVIRSYSDNGVIPEFNTVTFLRDGSIENANRIETLRLTSGWTYFLTNDQTVSVGKILTDDPCEGLITLSNYSYSQDPAYMELADTDTLNGFNITGISFVRITPVIATGSVDGGFNFNVNFIEGTGRTLYWVGGDGDWNDPGNWSLSSGGPGGECIPTVLDDVFFDENSFDTEGDRVYGANDQSAFCHDINFDVPNFNGSLDIFMLNVYGDINFVEEWAVYGSSVEILSNSEPQSIRSSGTMFQNVNFRGSQVITIEDDMNINDGMFIEGPITLETRGNDFNMNHFHIFSNTGRIPTLDLSNSSFTFSGERRGFFFPFEATGNEELNMSVANTVFVFTHMNTGAEIRAPIELGGLLFTNVEGMSEILIADELAVRKIDFSNDGILSGEVGLQVDSLIFNSGKSYQFESSRTQRVLKYLQARGNNCTPIEWGSSSSGVKAEIEMTSSTRIDMDFVEMRDIRANGGGPNDAGSHSTDIAGSNEGWTFPVVTDEVQEDGFFGPDILVCDDTDLILQPFSEEEISSIVWSTGSTDVSVNVTENTTLGAFVTFANNCTIQDTISVTFDESFQINLGPDTTLCEGSNLTLDLSLANASYLWQDGSIDGVYPISTEGSYYVDVAVSTCISSDTINVAFQSQIELDLEDQVEACEGESIVLDANINGPASYEWTTGENASSVEVFSEGIYAVTVVLDACTASDSIATTFHSLPEISSMEDVTICDEESVSIGIPSNPNFEYLWSSNQIESEITVDEEGEYALVVTDDNGCTNSDSLYLTVLPLPRFDLPADTLICQGESLELTIEPGYDAYSWNTGETSSSISTSVAGVLSLTTSLNGCTFADSTTLTVQALPNAQLGSDTTLCDGQTLDFDLAQAEASYLWSDGSTESSFSASTAQNIAVEVDINSCISMDDVVLSIKETPFFALDTEYSFCMEESIDLSISAQNDWTILWSNGESGDAITVSEPGEIMVETELNGCLYSQTTQITENPLPEFDLGPDGDKCEESVITLEVPLVNAEIVWQDGTMGQFYDVVNGGTYGATVMSQNGCVYSDEIVITDVTCTRFAIYTPNAFSPNNDGVNDLYHVGVPTEVIVLDYEMYIYDRWGNELFATRNINSGWDGRAQGQALMPGTYTWTIRIRYSDDFVEDEETSLQGSLLLTK